jgi:phage terminase small subunit
MKKLFTVSYMSYNDSLIMEVHCERYDIALATVESIKKDLNILQMRSDWREPELFEEDAIEMNGVVFSVLQRGSYPSALQIKVCNIVHNETEIPNYKPKYR